jgi:hypothetical protein
MATLGEIIKTRRKLKHLSLRKFSKLCDLSHTYIENLERGTSPTGKRISPTIGALIRITKTLEMPLEQLLTEAGYIRWKPRSINTNKIREIRKNLTYDDICKDIFRKTGNHFLPYMYENLEKGRNLTPPSILIDVLSEYTSKPKSFFYNDNPTSKRIKFIDEMPSFGVIFPSGSEKKKYIELAKELYDRNIDPDKAREALYDKVMF